jgi:hypothetical protein
MDNETNRMTFTWITQIINKVTRGRWRVIATCLITDRDIEHDLFLDALRDPLFAKRLNAFGTELEAAAFACGYLNRAWHRRKKSYLVDWQRLH